MKIIYKARDIIEAHIVSGMLIAHGIEAHVGGFYLQGGIGDLAASDFANVQVADEDVASALPLITAYDGKRSSDTTKSNAGGEEQLVV